VPVTLEQLAARLQIDEATLREYGLSDAPRFNPPAVKIPYFDLNGRDVTARFLTSLDAFDRFRQQRGDPDATLYGLSRLPHMAGDALTLTTHELDALTLWYEGIPALGLPGAAAWNEDRDADYLERFQKIFIVVPYTGSVRTSILDWLAKSQIRERAWLVDLPEQYIDLAAMYQASAENFAARYQELCEEAVDFHEMELEELRRQREQAQNLARRILACPDILAEVAAVARDELDIAQEENLVKLVYLVMTSRLLNRIVSLIVKGASATGKSHTVKQVLRLFPPGTRLERTSMSERALIYMNGSLEHKMLVIYEATGLTKGFGAYIIRSLLSEGEIRHSTPTGQFYKRGPTGLIVTTTETALHPENETRCLSVNTDDSPAHTRAIMAMVARGRSGNRSRGFASRAAWHALQDFVELGLHEVAIPYGEALSNLIPPAALRLRRDISTILSLIETHALLHQATRERDADGRIIAEVKDYDVVRDLIGEIISAEAGVGVPEIVIETHAAVASLIERGAPHVTLQQLSCALGVDTSTAHYRVSKAIALGVIRNAQGTRYRTAQLVLGDPIPDTRNLLPTVEQLTAAIQSRLQRPNR
jgi:hypothetical protein